MPETGEIAEKVRSKNAGPFWVTMTSSAAAPGPTPASATARHHRGGPLLGVPTQELERFDIPQSNVINLSAPRPAIEGTLKDRDMHGSGWAVLIAELNIA